MSSQEPVWTQHQQTFLQNDIHKVREEFMKKYSYDLSDVSVEVHSLETSSWRAADYRQEIKIKKGDSVLLLLELADLDDRESESAFLQFLSMIDGCFLPIGTALKLNRLELATDLDDSEIVALTYLASFLLMSFAELVVGEEALMNAQPPVFLESWKRAFMHNPDKLIEFEGVRYLRSDSPASNHH